MKRTFPRKEAPMFWKNLLTGVQATGLGIAYAGILAVLLYPAVQAAGYA